MQWYNIILDTFSGMRPTAPYNYYDINANGTWSFVMTGVVRRITNIGTWPNSPNMFYSGFLDAEPTITNWPTDAVVGEDYPFECRWTNYPMTTSYNTGQWRLTNQPPVEDQGFILAGATLKGYRVA